MACFVVYNHSGAAASRSSQHPDVYQTLATNRTMNVFSESVAQKILTHNDSSSVASHVPKMEIALPVFDVDEDVLLESVNDHTKSPATGKPSRAEVSSRIEISKSPVPNK